MNTRDFTKVVVQTVVSSTAAAAIANGLVVAVPKTKRFKIAEAAGAVGGWAISEEAKPYTDKLVDNLFDRREARKTSQ